MWLASFVLMIAAWTGALLAEGGKGALKRQMAIVSAFGGAFIVGMLFLHLIPEMYGMTAAAGYWVLAGFLIQGTLEYASQGVEHGHMHVHPHSSGKTGWSAVPWAIFGSLCLHALVEAMPLAHGHDASDHAGHTHGIPTADIDLNLLTGLALHHIPVALVLMGLLQASGVPALRRWFLITAFGAMPLLGMGVFEILVHSPYPWASALPGIAGSVVIGILLHISTTMLFESADGHSFNVRKLAATLAGLALAVVSL
jgi:zinc and cadmium transporter